MLHWCDPFHHLDVDYILFFNFDIRLIGHLCAKLGCDDYFRSRQGRNVINPNNVSIPFLNYNLVLLWRQRGKDVSRSWVARRKSILIYLWSDRWLAPYCHLIVLFVDFHYLAILTFRRGRQGILVACLKSAQLIPFIGKASGRNFTNDSDFFYFLRYRYLLWLYLQH